MITFENLSFSYGNTGEEQLNSLDLQIKKGEFVLLCGRSACGKTTATKCINGLIPHFTEGKYSGSVVVKGKEIAKKFVLAGVPGEMMTFTLSKKDVKGELTFVVQ